MRAIIRFLFPLIGYLATATVITLGILIGYLWKTERLTDDKMFRMVALLQGVDLQQIAESQKTSGDETPPEEPSLDALVSQQQVLDRNYEVKLLSLQRARQDFDQSLQELKVEKDRFARLARESLDQLKQQEEVITQENLAKVVSDMEQLAPASAKELLMQYIKDDRMPDVITLLGKMSENKKGKILKSFSTPEELQKLYEIHRLMTDATAEKEKYAKAVDELQSVKQPGQ